MTRNFPNMEVYPKSASQSWLPARAPSEKIGKSQTVVRDIACALSGLAHMVLVMMILEPSRAITPAPDGEPVTDSFAVTLTISQRWQPATPAGMPTSAEQPLVHQAQAEAARPSPHSIPRIPQHRPAKPAETTPASSPVETVAAPPGAAEPAVAPVQILHPKFREPPEPAAYPPKALALNQQGEVLVRARIDPDGNPDNVELARGSGFPMLDEAALVAVRRWRFVPAQVGGVAVAATVQVPVIFHLQ